MDQSSGGVQEIFAEGKLRDQARCSLTHQKERQLITPAVAGYECCQRRAALEEQQRSNADPSPSPPQMTSLDARFSSILDSRAERQILRSLTPSQATQQPLVDFSSNDYLSLARSPLLRQKFLSTLQNLPSPYGPPSSRLLDGNSSHHLALEAQLANFFCAEAGLLFNSGFDANVGAWTVLPDKNDWIVYDELIHASVHDGMRAARVEKGKRRSFKHNDVQDLRTVLAEVLRSDVGVQKGERNVWVGVETLYSMDGDLSPLKEIVELVESMLPRGNGHMVVDEVSSESSLSASTFLLTDLSHT